MLSRDVQPANAYEPINLIELGIVILLIVGLSLKAFALTANTGKPS